MFTNKYPYTDNHELNLDWMLKKIKELEDRVKALEEQLEEVTEDVH